MARERKDLLLDIVLLARQAQSFVAGCERRQFDNDLMRQWAVDRALSIIGEAVSKLDEATQQSLIAAAVPVRQIVRMRNRLVHEYWETDPEILWKTATEDMEPLLAAIAPLLPVCIEPPDPPETDDTSSVQATA